MLKSNSTPSDLKIRRQGQIEPFYQDEVTSAWRSDSQRNWKIYSKTESYRANWDFHNVESRT